MPKIIRGGEIDHDDFGFYHQYSGVTEESMEKNPKFLLATAKNAIMPELLRRLLAQPTPHGYEKLLHQHLPFLKDTKLVVMADKKGNIIVDIGKIKTDFRTAFSCHMDTVHTTMQRDKELSLFVTTASKKDKTQEAGMVYAGIEEFDKDGNSKGIFPSVLGADDKVGVYILCKMIEARIPGRYMFHVGEERGCVGSNYIANTTPQVLAGIDRAIAFDRMNYGDVIAHQKGDRGSSVKFSDALALALNAYMPPHERFKGDVVGMFTDTGNYHKIVHECCNLSVGYFNQHGKDEHFDLIWLEKILLPAILKVDWEKLPTVRDKNVVEVRSYGTNWQNKNTNYSGGRVAYDKITDTTPAHNLPIYDLAEGYIILAGRVGMQQLLKEWIWKAGSDYQNRSPNAAKLVGILAENHNMKLEIANMKHALISQVDGPRFKQQYKCAMIDRIHADWEKIIGKGKLANKIEPDNLVRMKHLSILLNTWELSSDLINIKLGLAFGVEHTEKLNMFLMQVTAAASIFKEHDQRLKKHLGDIVRYMWENSDEPVFEKYKAKLNEWPEIVRNKKIKVKPQTLEAAPLAEQKATPKSEIPNVSDAVQHHPKINDCGMCGGTGFQNKHFGERVVQCWLCAGKPKQLRLVDLSMSRDKNFKVCGSCNGTGRAAGHEAGFCYTCGGNGESTIKQISEMQRPHIVNLGSVLEPVKATTPVSDDTPTVH